MTSDASRAHLAAWLGAVHDAVGDAIERRRPAPGRDDRFRGLYVSEEDAWSLLAAPEGRSGGRARLAPRQEAEADADAAEARGEAIRLRKLIRTFGLDEVDIAILIVALAPDLDARYERLYGYLHDDVTRRRASIGLALELVGLDGANPGRSRLGPDGPLVAGDLVEIEEGERPFLTRSLRVPDRVAAHLLGDDRPDPAVAGLAMTTCPLASPESEIVARALGGDSRLAYIRERPGASGHSLAIAAAQAIGWRSVALDLRRLPRDADIRALARVAAREARLAGAALVAGPVEALPDRDADAVRAFADLPWAVLLVGAKAWDPTWSSDVPLLVTAPVPAPAERDRVWSAALGAGAGIDAAAATAPFRLTPDQIGRAAVSARLTAAAEQRPVTAADLCAGARAQNAAGLGRLAHRVQPGVAWGDLVLPREVIELLGDISLRARLADTVLGGWGLGRRARRGVSALFAGESGTGKTMAAEVVAADLALDLYTVDLSTVVDKYIGETEKHLDRIFTEAEHVNGVIFFDEADALFGKRSDVKDARDRYANVEVAYLLQRLETFDGIAVLATNLRGNVDEAFTRRLDVVVDFPMPDAAARHTLWDRCLGPGVPRAADVDFDFLAERFELSGGNIRNIAVAAAFFAAGEGRAVEMTDLIRGTHREYRKLGRLCVEAEFGPWFATVAPLEVA